MKRFARLLCPALWLLVAQATWAAPFAYIANSNDSSSSLTGTSNVITASAAATQFAVSTPASTTAGVALSFTVTALDAFNNPATGYAGTVQFTSSDGSAVLPGNSTLTNGVGTFSATLKTAGNQAITATDTANTSITGTSGSFVVVAGAATHFAFTNPPPFPFPPGPTHTFGVQIIALDQFNNTDTTYNGTPSFYAESQDASHPFQGPMTLVPDPAAGVWDLTGWVASAGVFTFYAVDGSITGHSNAFTVVPGLPIFYAVSVPSSATAGIAFTFTVTATDNWGNITTNSQTGGTFASSDSNATLPGSSGFYGVGTFSATLRTAGSQGIGFTSVSPPGVWADGHLITVSAGPATHFGVSLPSTATAGAGFSYIVTALDAFNNVATGYTGTAHFTSSDGSATLPANSTLTNGVGTFSATLRSAGNRTITATDTLAASITGTSGAIAVNPATSGVMLTTSCQGTFVAGQSFTATATVTGSSPTGTVNFLAGGNNITGCTGVTLHTGSASCDANNLPIGDGAMTANYSGDANNSSSISLGLDITILDPTDVVSRNSFEEVVAGCPME